MPKKAGEDNFDSQARLAKELSAELGIFVSTESVKVGGEVRDKLVIDASPEQHINIVMEKVAKAMVAKQESLENTSFRDR